MRRIILITSVCLLLILLRFYHFFGSKIDIPDGSKVSFTTKLLSEPKQAKFQTFTVRYSKTQFLVTVPAYPEFHYGDTLLISGKTSKGSRGSWGSKGLFFLYFPQVAVQKSKSWLDLFGVVSLIRQKALRLIERSLPTPSSSLLAGIVMGVKQEMPKEFKKNLQTMGVYHVVAASGMNVTMVSGALLGLFGFFFRRQWAIGVSMIGIFLYSLLSGFEPSIIRATIMGEIVMIGQLLGRQTLAVYTLALAGFFMLMWDPELVSDIGFQLSFVATLGLLYIKPLFESRLIKKIPIGDDVTTTIAAQIATLPLLLTYFGSYSLLSVIVNGLVLWTIPILMVIGAVGLLMGFLFEPLGTLILYGTMPFLWVFQLIVSSFSKISFGFSLSSLPLSLIVGYYLIVISIYLFVQNKRHE